MKNLIRVLTYPFYIGILVMISDVVFGLGIIEFFEEDFVIFFLILTIMGFLGITLDNLIKIREGRAEKEDYVFLLIWVLILIFVVNVLFD